MNLSQEDLYLWVMIMAWRSLVLILSRWMHDGIVRTIQEVRHVKVLKKNLLSLGQLDDLGCKSQIENGIMKIVRGVLVVMRTTKVQVEDNPKQEDLDSFKAELEHEVQESVESEAIEVRRSTRERRPSAWHSKYVTKSNVAYCLLTEDEEPMTFHEATNSLDASLWMTAMQEEIEALHKNKTWELVPLPHGRKAIGNKWVYKIKRDGNDEVDWYRARPVVKGYAQKQGINFNEIFSPVVRLTTVRVVLAMCAMLDLHLE
ncbi:hypothetical protein EZV62_015034 [Acer yangbiense]|uniref:Reverse transcriptase Ty1/copia-type domain-containing protein n=1 Tax=Acer yangbiense TaxID=1000413 RepID=A0A5C7HTQ5_9ROSI|nr:hypothetical protein EZV62_015034 [Acer yangbiense]